MSASKGSTYAWMLCAAAAGRLVILVVLRAHWGWQPPYHLSYLRPPDWFEPSVGEYLVAHMPLYAMFLRLVGLAPWNIYVAAPFIQTLLQLLGIAWLTTLVAFTFHPRRLAPAVALAVALGLDPWLCDTAIVMQPASLTSTLFILLVERAATYSSRTLERRHLPSWTAVVTISALICAIGAYLRSDFAAYVALLPVAVGLAAGLTGLASWGRAAAFAIGATGTALMLVIALLLPRALYLRAQSGALIMTTNTGGGALWYGLGEVPNPWNIPNPELGDDPIEQFARAHGYAYAFASARTSAFFKKLFVEHIRERPAFLLKVGAARIHRVLLGWPPASVTFRGEYESWPQVARLGQRLTSGERWYGLLLTREYGPWVLKHLGLRYFGTALIWLTALAAAWYLVRWPPDPILLLPALSYGVGVGIFVLVHWSYRYGQQFYWLGYLSAYLITAASRPLPRQQANIDHQAARDLQMPIAPG